MQQSYDVGIIGAGLGGICTGARLTRKGYRVLMVEKLPFFGGRFSHKEYKGFTLPTGAIIAQGGGSLESTFKEAGLEYPIKIAENPGIRVRLHGEDIDLSQKGGGLNLLFSKVLKDPEEKDRVKSAFRNSLQWFSPLDSITFKEWLTQHSRNESLHGIFQGWCGAFVGINADEVTAGEFFRFLRSVTGKTQTFGYAPHGAGAVVDPLIQVIRNLGGDVVSQTKAKRIIIERNQAKGILIENKDGQLPISCRLVISNAGPKKTVELGGRENFERSYLVALRDQIKPVTVVTVCAAVDKDLLDFSGVVIFGSCRRLVLMVCPTLTCPDLAPKGKHLLVSYSVPKFTMGPLKLKETFDLTMADYQENYPAFNKYGEVLMWDSFYGDWPVYHSWPGYDLPYRTPVRNLLNVGDGVKPYGWSGLESVAECARLVAEDAETILKS